MRGARASLYGSEAIGGVINIITKARSQQQGTTVSAGLVHWITKNSVLLLGLRLVKRPDECGFGHRE